MQARVEAVNSLSPRRALLALENAEEMEKATQRIAALSMSVRQTENYVQGLIDPAAGQEGAESRAARRSERARRTGATAKRPRIEGHDRRPQRPRQGDHRVRRLEDFDALMERLVGSKK